MVTQQRCTQRNCTGTIEDGYCDVCGHAPGKRIESPRIAPAATASRSVVTGTGSTPMSRAAKGSRRSRRTSSRTTRRQLGAGLISLPELPSTDPEKTVLLDPKIPEHKRFCSKCDAPLKRDFGFCGKCGQKFSFIPSVKAGDIIASQYEVKGALAFGGLGWIYLAFDRLLSRYVVLKGLLNVHDASSAAVAVAERQFLASVKHPNIVGIYNFVQHGSEGFIVMEYVGGKSLKQIRQERGPLPPAEAVAYIHRILSAFSYLHNAGLVYCDFKPDNVMLERDDVKLIDMGAVRRLDDAQGDIYSTAGFSAPEAAEGPTPASDLYTIGRTLAGLLADFRGFTTDYRYSLPSPTDVPVFAQQESLYRFLLKATAQNPDDRFENADEMADQLLGVLREIVALSSEQPRPATSAYFSVDPLVLESGEDMCTVQPDARYVPLPLIDTSDPGARPVSAAIAVPEPKKRIAALELASSQFPNSREARLRLAAAHGDAGHHNVANRMFDELSTEDPWDWRVLWLRGRMRLANGDAHGARQDFDQVYFDLPGELAPKFALGLAAERAGNLDLARRMFDLVSRVDDTMVSAVFGLARCAMAAHDRTAAVSALSRVPATSPLLTRARVHRIWALVLSLQTAPAIEQIVDAASTCDALPIDPYHRGELRKMILAASLDLLRTAKAKPKKDDKVFGVPLKEKNLRLELERTLRSMAQLVTGPDRIRLVDEANAVRPRSLF